MTPTDRGGLSVVLLLGVTSLAWAFLAPQPYWAILSAAAVTLTIRSIVADRPYGAITMSLAALPLFIVPSLGILAGPPSWSFLAGLMAPVLLYSLTSMVIARPIEEDGRYGTGALLFLTLLGTIAGGTLALLSLYYIDAFLFSELIPSNSDLMWPLSLLLLGAIVTSAGIKAAGLERAMAGEKEVSG